MMSDKLRDKRPERDLGFWQHLRSGQWEQVAAPELGAPVFDSHTHLHATQDPVWELVRCAAYGVDSICEIYDPAADDIDISSDPASWQENARALLPEVPNVEDVPSICFAAGIHPHHADAYDEDLEATLRNVLAMPGSVAIGEIGLDYFRDNAPRDAQRRVFRRQIRIAHELSLPVSLHLRSSAKPERGNAHAEAFEIMCDEGFPQAGTLLHCCTLSPDLLSPWIDRGCFVAYGGAITYKNSEDARAGARLVPPDRLLFETDAPYMAPEPFKGTKCNLSHILFTAAYLAELFECNSPNARAEFLQRVHANTKAFYRIS